LALEDRLNVIILQGDQALRSGNAAVAITQYESALAMVNREQLLAEQKNHVPEKLANGYMKANRAQAAVSIYFELLEARKQDCASATFALSECAGAQHSLGLAQMQAGDFQNALASLRNAETNYGKAEKLTEFHEISVVEAKDQAQVRLLIAITLFRLGRTSEAITTVEAAVPQLTLIQSDESIQIAVRDDAGRSLQDAQTLLSRFKSPQ
jgi:tetratricopeptide (TPR) repeat protein